MGPRAFLPSLAGPALVSGQTGTLSRATAWFNRYGVWSLLLSWMPIIGDPITLVAGVLKVAFWRFLGLVAVAKTIRYMVVLGMVEWTLS